MTKQRDIDSETGDRPAQTKMELTDEMLEAGAWALRDWLGSGRDGDTTHSLAFQDGAKMIFQQILTASKTP